MLPALVVTDAVHFPLRTFFPDVVLLRLYSLQAATENASLIRREGGGV